jgi:hypothetical protein
MSKRYSYNVFLLITVLFFSVSAKAQNTVVSGTIRDSRNATIPFVSVIFVGSTNGMNSDIQGKYKLSARGSFTQIKFTYVGYKAVIKNIIPGKEQTLDIVMEEDTKVLNEVVITSKKRNYSNKNNPAVELIRQVIEHKPLNRAENYDYLQYNEYERIQFSLNDLSGKITDKKIFQKYKFLLDYPDTVNAFSKASLPVFMQEKISKNYYRKSPEKKVQIITAKKEVNFGEYFDQEGFTMYLNRMYADVDIYTGNIFVMTNQFLSPIADSAPTFYRFFITDTIRSANNEKLVELSFLPRNKTDLLFEGKLYVTMDGNYAISKVDLGVNKDINLNWVRELHLNQDFEKSSDGRYHISRTKLMVSFGILKTKGPSVYGERTVFFKDYLINKPANADQYRGESVQTLPNALKSDDNTWQNIRPDTLKAADAKIYSNIDSLEKMPSFRRTAGLIVVLSTGFKATGPVDIGPIGSFYSFNPVEGSRLGFGGRTTPKFSKRIYFQSFGAYGLNDEKWKYLLSTTYALNNKSIYTFPQHFLQVSFRRDTRIPGQELQYALQNANFFMSFTHGDNNKWLYNDIARLDYLHEFSNHFSYSLGLKNWRQQPAGSLTYVREGNPLVPVSTLTTTELSFGMRWAPHEQFFQGTEYRYSVPNKYPIISAGVVAGVKGLINGEYNYQNLNFNIFKCIYLSQLGFTNVTLEGSYMFGQAPYPLLSIHHANQTYSFQHSSYNLMNFLEFVSDHYASLNLEHSFNGFFLNKVPLLRKLRLLEYIGIKALSGGIREENNPITNPSLYKFPTGINGVPLTYALGNVPYIEGNIGIGNLLKIFRFDLVKRFNYLDHPGVTRVGIRTGMSFDF